MKPKKTKLSNFKLSDAARGALEADTARTGKTMTQVIEDRMLWQRVFSDDAETVLDGLRRKTGLPTHKIVELCVLKAGKSDRSFPFEAAPTNEPSQSNGIVAVRGSNPLDSTNAKSVKHPRTGECSSADGNGDLRSRKLPFRLVGSGCDVGTRSTFDALPLAA